VGVTAPGDLSRADLARVALAAGVDPRTVVRCLRGRTRSDVVRAAIVAALRANGFRREAREIERPR
jgi:DNA-binding LacI/PurR family transcriptional regulator